MDFWDWNSKRIILIQIDVCNNNAEFIASYYLISQING